MLTRKYWINTLFLTDFLHLIWKSEPTVTWIYHNNFVINLITFIRSLFPDTKNNDRCQDHVTWLSHVIKEYCQTSFLFLYQCLVLFFRVMPNKQCKILWQHERDHERRWLRCRVQALIFVSRVLIPVPAIIRFLRIGDEHQRNIHFKMYLCISSKVSEHSIPQSPWFIKVISIFSCHRH